MEDKIRLRKLSWKSVLDFGKYNDLSVQQVYDLGHTRALRWYYYNLGKISFLPEVLRAIGIEEENEIQKPGKDPEKGKSLDEKMNQRMKEFCGWAFRIENNDCMKKVFKQKQIREKDKQMELKRYEKMDMAENTKGKLQSKNHGHY